MLILTPKEVEFCRQETQRYLAEEYSSFYYRGFLFIKVGNYRFNQFQAAIEKSREFLDQSEPVVAIILKEIDRITVWAESEELIKVI